MVGKLMTRQGYKMNFQLRQKIVEAMAARKGETLEQIARGLGIHRRTLSDYLTDETYTDIARHDGPHEPSVDDVDRAMLRLASKGNVAAARLVYMRMAQKGVTGPMPTLDELEQELRKLKQMEDRHDDTRADDADALGADATG